MGAENEPEQPHTPIEGTEQVAVRNLEAQKRRRKAVGCLLQVFALQLTLFGLLAWYVHFYPIVPLDVAITHSFQQNQIRDDLCFTNARQLYWLYHAVL